MASTPDPRRNSVFLCHASPDKEIVRDVAKAIRNAGLSVWLDSEQIAPGDNVVLTISEGLSQSRFVLVFLSKNFIESKWTQQEWSHVFHDEVDSRTVRIIPVLIGELPDDLPSSLGLLRAKHYVDLRENSRDTGLQTLLRHLQTHLAGDSSTSGNPAGLGGSASAETLTIRCSSGPSDTLRLSYFLDDSKLQEATILSRQVRSLQLAISTDLPRLLYRYGRNAMARVEDVGRRLSPALIPPEVSTKLREKRINEIRIVAESADPPLPWELLHDGHGFVALTLPIATVPASGRKSVAPFAANEILLVDAAIGGVSHGFDLGAAKWPALERVNLESAQVARASVASTQDLRDAIISIPSAVVHLTSHMRKGGSQEGFVIGDEVITADALASMVRDLGSTRLVVLSACESGVTVGSSLPFSFERNPAYLVAMEGCYAVGTVGWLEMTTSSAFDEIFLTSLIRTQRPERAILEARQELARRGLEWWLFALFAPGTATSEYRPLPEAGAAEQRVAADGAPRCS